MKRSYLGRSVWGTAVDSYNPYPPELVPPRVCVMSIAYSGITPLAALMSSFPLVHDMRAPRTTTYGEGTSLGSTPLPFVGILNTCLR